MKRLRRWLALKIAPELARELEEVYRSAEWLADREHVTAQVLEQVRSALKTPAGHDILAWARTRGVRDAIG